MVNHYFRLNCSPQNGTASLYDLFMQHHFHTSPSGFLLLGTLFLPLSQFMDSTTWLNGKNPPMVMVRLLLTSCRIGFTPFSLLFPLVPTLSFRFTQRYTQTYTPMLQYLNPTQSLSDLVASSFCSSLLFLLFLGPILPSKKLKKSDILAVHNLSSPLLRPLFPPWTP